MTGRHADFKPVRHKSAPSRLTVPLIRIKQVCDKRTIVKSDGSVLLGSQPNGIRLTIMEDAMSAENQAKAQILPINALFSPNITQAQAHATNMLTQTTELMTKMSRELWEAQTRLMQVEAQQGAKVFAQPAAGGRPGEALGAYNQQLRESSERMVEHLRQVNDLMRDYSWQMLDIYAANLSKATKPIQDAMQRKS
ncbi:hypothetical protein D7I39_12525 [Allopusillimonas ginsengisoli]|nr:hypothetical protein D7I39_12525 [Allopusillimonas ginsengisoli]